MNVRTSRSSEGLFSRKLIRKGCVFLALAVVPLASAAAIPLAASTDTVAFYPMTESAVGTVFKTLRSDGAHFGTNTLMRSAVVRPDVNVAKYSVWTRFYGPEYVEVSADVPGSYLFANATDPLPMADSYRSLRQG